MSLDQLLLIPMSERDEKWEDHFLEALTQGTLRLLSPDPQNGPDGWPYLLAETSDHGESAQQILAWLATRGIGLAINPQKDSPDYILSWGMIWSFRETGRFLRRDQVLPEGRFEAGLKDLAHAGTPNPSYLPDFVRSVLREFFRDQGVLQPRILVISMDRINYELAFSLESLGNPPESEWEGIAEAISWFLPPHYSIVLVSEKQMPPFSAL